MRFYLVFEIEATHLEEAVLVGKETAGEQMMSTGEDFVFIEAKPALSTQEGE